MADSPCYNIFPLRSATLLVYPPHVSQQDERWEARGEPHPSAAAELAGCGDGDSYQKERRGGKNVWGQKKTQNNNDLPRRRSKCWKMQRGGPLRNGDAGWETMSLRKLLLIPSISSLLLFPPSPPQLRRMQQMLQKMQQQMHEQDLWALWVRGPDGTRHGARSSFYLFRYLFHPAWLGNL